MRVFHNIITHEDYILDETLDSVLIMELEDNNDWKEVMDL
jgi:hypothetical protein